MKHSQISIICKIKKTFRLTQIQHATSPLIKVCGVLFQGLRASVCWSGWSGDLVAMVGFALLDISEIIKLLLII